MGVPPAQTVRGRGGRAHVPDGKAAPHDFRHMCRSASPWHARPAMTQARLIAIAGVIAWSMVGLPAFIHHAGPLPYDFRWIATFALFGAVFALDLRRPRLLFLGV